MFYSNWSLKAVQARSKAGCKVRRRGWLVWRESREAGYLLETSDVQFNSSTATTVQSTTTQRSLIVTWTYWSVGVWRYVTAVARKDEHVFNTVWRRGTCRVRAPCVTELRRFTAKNCNITCTNKPSVNDERCMTSWLHIMLLHLQRIVTLLNLYALYK